MNQSSRRLHRQAQPQSMDNPVNRREWHRVLQPNIRQPLGLGNVHQSAFKTLDPIFLQHDIQKLTDIAIRLEVCRNIKRHGHNSHIQSLQISQQITGLPNILRLRRLVAARQQQDNNTAPDGVINPITRTKEKAQLIQGIVQTLKITEVPITHPVNPCSDTERNRMGKGIKPRPECLSGLNLKRHPADPLLSITSSRNLHRQAQAQRLNHPINSGKARVSILSQRLIQTRAACTDLFRQRRHALRAGSSAQSMEELLGRSLQCRLLKEADHILIGFQQFSHVKRAGFNSHHHLLQIIQQGMGFMNVTGLAGFVPANQQQNNLPIPHRVVNTQTATKKAAQFKQTAAQCLMIPEVPALNAHEAVSQLATGHSIPERDQPFIKRFGGTNFIFHADNCIPQETKIQVSSLTLAQNPPTITLVAAKSATGRGNPDKTERTDVQQRLFLRLRFTVGVETVPYGDCAGQPRGWSVILFPIFPPLHSSRLYSVERIGRVCNTQTENTIMPPITIFGTDISIRNDFYSLNDLHRAAGGDDKHKTSNFLRLEQTQALITEIEKGSDVSLLAVEIVKGRNGGTFVCKELVYAYAMWISPKFNLAVIRAFDQLASGGNMIPAPAQPETVALPAPNTVTIPAADWMTICDLIVSLGSEYTRTLVDSLQPNRPAPTHILMPIAAAQRANRAVSMIYTHTFKQLQGAK